jgi:2-oxoglutarate ferredoxin oxidoreductase subunit beta
MVTASDYAGLTPAWCPGCGDFGILRALNKALVDLGLEPHQILLVSGIGQAGKLPHYTRGNVFNSLHGRPLPVAVGARITNPNLKVIAFSGDGDAYGEGGNHFVHTARRNHDITYVVHDNQVYGLTKGQASPTTDAGYATGTTPEGAINPINPVLMALASGATFVARSFAGDTDHLSSMIEKGITHRGFAVIDILQPCVSFNHKNTYAWYKERVYKLDETNHDPGDKMAAFGRSQEWGDKIPIGIFLQLSLPAYEDRLSVLKSGPLAGRETDPAAVAPMFEAYV